MDTNALELLEFPAVLDRIAAAASTDHGIALARALAPSAVPQL